MTVRNLHLQDERGVKEETVNLALLEADWPRFDDESYVCLRFLDPYGNVVFNRLQAAVLEGEIERLMAALTDDSKKSILARVLELTRTCKRGGHLYLRFDGD